MGLAASQARFLAITSRKNSCEFQSMQIAQQKLSLTRELEAATQDYQEALNTTKLIWDPDGSGATPFDLSYNLLMYPSDVNDYVPWMLSRRDGKIALNSDMARAAKLAGIPEGGTNVTGQAKRDLYDAFITAMVGCGGMSETSAANCRLIGLQEQVGIGGILMNKAETSEMTITNMINYIDIAASKLTTGSDEERKLADLLTFSFPQAKVEDKKWVNTHESPHFSETLTSSSMYLTINGNRVSNEKGPINFTLADLLNENVTIVFTNEKNSKGFFKRIASAVKDLLGNGSSVCGGKAGIDGLLGKDMYPDDATEEDKIVIDIANQMIKGFMAILDVGDNAADIQAFNYAIQETLALLGDTKDLGSRNHSNDAFNDCITNSNDYNGWVSKGAAKNKNFGSKALSLSNLAESFLTFYAQGKEGYNDKYYIRQDGNKSSYVTDDYGYYYKIKNVDDDGLTTKQIYESEFYSALFNNLCQSGWYENIYIDDKEYLDNALKNGQLFITSMNKDGYYYQDKYNAGEYIMEATDEDAVTQAELEFTQKKSKINYKEEQLDLDMKNLDLEISSLTTEYDTVKNLITKNVEKTFTMFQS